MVIELVLDASILVEPFASPTDEEAIVLAHLQGEHPSSAPMLLAWEVGNYFFGRRAARLGRPLVERQGAFEESLAGIELVPWDETRRRTTACLVERHGLTFYDASYLALAVERDAALVTRDAALAVACRGERVPTYDLKEAAAAIARGEL